MNELRIEEHRDRGGAAAHVDQRNPELRLILDEAAERRGIGRYDLAGDLQVAACDAVARLRTRRRMR